MAFSRRSIVALSLLASASLTADAAMVDAGTLVGVSVDSPYYDTRSSLPYGCPPAGCVAANTRVSASWKLTRLRHPLTAPPLYRLDTLFICGVVCLALLFPNSKTPIADNESQQRDNNVDRQKHNCVLCGQIVPWAVWSHLLTGAYICFVWQPAVSRDIPHPPTTPVILLRQGFLSRTF